MSSSFSAFRSEFLVNTFTTGRQGDPNIAANPATGGFQVVWESVNQTGDGLDGYYQNFTARGAAVGAEGRINDVIKGDQENFAVAINEDGNGAWVWETNNRWSSVNATGGALDRDEEPQSGGIVDDVRTRSKIFGFEGEDYYSHDRVRYGRHDEIEGRGGFEQQIISVGGDQFVMSASIIEPQVNYQGVDIDEFTAYTPDVVPTNGQWSRRTVEDERFPKGQTSSGDVGELQDGRIITVYSMHSAIEGDDGNIQYQIFTRSGSQGVPFSIEPDQTVEGSGTNGHADTPRVQVLNDGGFVVTWVERDETDPDPENWTGDIYFQIYNADETVRVHKTLAHEASAEDQSEVEITYLKDGGFMMTWTSQGDDGAGAGVMAARFDENGVRLGDVTVVNETTAGYQGDAALATLSNGKVAVVWEGAGDGGGSGVFGTIFKVPGYGAGKSQTLTGTDADEVFSTGARSDSVNGMGGDDKINGGDARDTLNGGDGRDVVRGQAGHDVVDGQGGNDKVFGGDGNDNASGGDGRDKVFGDAGNDTVNGGAGNDRLVGGGDDDILNGGRDDDRLFGGAGADTLDGGRGDDQMTGGGAADCFIYAEGNDVVVDFQDNVDVLKFDATLGDGTLTRAELRDFVIERADKIIFKFDAANKLTVNGFSDYADIRDDISIA